MLTSSIRTRSFGRARRSSMRLPSWKGAGVAALVCGGVALASFPRPAAASSADEQRQWRALAVAPLSSGGTSGYAMSATDLVSSVGYVPRRAMSFTRPTPVTNPSAPSAAPLRIRGRVGDGFYWSLRAAGASPQTAADYLAALATEIDVGEVHPNDGFDMILSPGRELLYAGLERIGQSQVEMVRWTANGQSQWIDAANVKRPTEVESGLIMPAQGPITSYFGYRYHPILHFTRFHAGVDIGAGWGSPIVAAGDGRIIGAGWSGGYGREVQISHGGGLVSIYGHMSQIVAQPGSIVRRGQLIGYVGSSGLSTGPHLHFEVRQGNAPVNPLAVHFASAPLIDAHLADAVRARLKALLAIGAGAG